MGFFSNKQNNNGYTNLNGMNNDPRSYNNNGFDNGYNNGYNNGYSNGFNNMGNDPYGNNNYYVQDNSPVQNNNTAVYNTNGMVTLADFTKKVYTLMFMGLAITFGIGLFFTLNPGLTLSLLDRYMPVYYILAGVEVLLVFVLGLFVRKLSPAAAAVIFVCYAAVNGITIAPLLVLCEISSVFSALAATGCIFGAKSAYAIFTKRDLSGIGPVLIFGLIGLLVYSVIAMLIHIPMSDLMISIIGIVLFMGFTAFDTQKIKAYYNSIAFNPEAAKKGAIVSALELYLDFINLFLYLLRLFAARNN